MQKLMIFFLFFFFFFLLADRFYQLFPSTEKSSCKCLTEMIFLKHTFPMTLVPFLYIKRRKRGALCVALGSGLHNTSWIVQQTHSTKFTGSSQFFCWNFHRCEHTMVWRTHFCYGTVRNGKIISFQFKIILIARIQGADHQPMTAPHPTSKLEVEEQTDGKFWLIQSQSSRNGQGFPGSPHMGWQSGSQEMLVLTLLHSFGTSLDTFIVDSAPGLQDTCPLWLCPCTCGASSVPQGHRGGLEKTSLKPESLTNSKLVPKQHHFQVQNQS